MNLRPVPSRFRRGAIEVRTLTVFGKPVTTSFLAHPEDGATEAATWEGGRLGDTSRKAGILVPALMLSTCARVSDV